MHLASLCKLVCTCGGFFTLEACVSQIVLPASETLCLREVILALVSPRMADLLAHGCCVQARKRLAALLRQEKASAGKKSARKSSNGQVSGTFVDPTLPGTRKQFRHLLALMKVSPCRSPLPPSFTLPLASTWAITRQRFLTPVRQPLSIASPLRAWRLWSLTSPSTPRARPPSTESA